MYIFICGKYTLVAISGYDGNKGADQLAWLTAQQMSRKKPMPFGHTDLYHTVYGPYIQISLMLEDKPKVKSYLKKSPKLCQSRGESLFYGARFFHIFKLREKRWQIYIIEIAVCRENGRNWINSRPATDKKFTEGFQTNLWKTANSRVWKEDWKCPRFKRYKHWSF